MEQGQQQQRRAAANEFIDSLNQLEGMLQVNETEDEVTPELSSASDDLAENSLLMDMEAFEEAVADIEQYLEDKTKKES